MTAGEYLKIGVLVVVGLIVKTAELIATGLEIIGATVVKKVWGYK